MIFMYDLQTIENRIMSIATQMGLSKNKLLINAKLGKSFFDNMKKGQIPSVEKLHIMADYLDVSVDYLLGRTDKPNVDASPATASAPTTQEPKLNEDELELLEMYRSLSKRARHELMVTTYEMKDQDELERDREIYINYDAI